MGATQSEADYNDDKLAVMDQEQEDNYLILFKCINPKLHKVLRSELDHYSNGVIDLLQIVKKYDTLDAIRETQQSVYKYDFQANLRCLKEVFKGTPITEDEIRTTLKILTGVPNPAMVAAKLFLHKIETTPRKRTSTSNGVVLNTKQTKLELNEPVDLDDDVNEQLDEVDEPALPKPNRVKFEIYKPPASVKRKNFLPKNNPGPSRSTTKTIRCKSSDQGSDTNTLALSELDNEVDAQLDGTAGSVLPKKNRLEFEISKLTPKSFLPKNIPGTSRAPPKSFTLEYKSSDTHTLKSSSIELDNDENVQPKDFPASSNSTNPLKTPLPVPNNGIIVVEEGDPEVEIINEEPIALLAEPVVDQRLVWKVLEMFPDVSREYLNQICQGKKYNDPTFAEILDLMLTSDYPRAPPRSPSPKISVTPEEQLAMLKEMFPDADPTYLEAKVQLWGEDKETFQQFIYFELVNKSYPTMKDYLRRQQLSAQQRQYTTEFDVRRFVELFPDPKAVFEAPNRTVPSISGDDFMIVCTFMRNRYPQLYVKDIQVVLKQNKCVQEIIKKLEELLKKNVVKKKRMKASTSDFLTNCQNIPLLQELAYITHKQEILNYIKEKEIQDAEDRLQAKKMGLLQTCTCCFDEEVMPKDMIPCLEGCYFCKACVKRSSEIALGEGKVNFPCLSENCNGEFSLQVLQTVLEPKVFSKMAQKRALAEVKAVLTDELESCPFCDFANIPAPEDKLFRCLNPECMKESCRSCKEPSHVPLRCDEVERDEHVKARTYVENKMTDALIRECWKCGNRFYKEEGCNKMTCLCGAKTCYVCRQPVHDYTHFNGQGGDRFDLCPLYTDNFTVNEKQVLEAGEMAKKEVGEDNLKHDPTVRMEKELQAQKKKSTEEMTEGPRYPHLIQNLRLPAQVLNPLMDDQFLLAAQNAFAHQHLLNDHGMLGILPQPIFPPLLNAPPAVRQPPPGLSPPGSPIRRPRHR